jgi:hypothetical protein
MKPITKLVIIARFKFIYFWIIVPIIIIYYSIWKFILD